MAWSTKELADLAGTTVNTVRHYHRVGLLDEPERRFNGYKQYEVHHLIKLLRIRRLADLGVPLTQMPDLSAESASPEGTSTADVLQDLDNELKSRIEQLQAARADIAAIIEYHAPADAPAGFEAVASKLSESDSSMIHIYTQLFDKDALDDVQKMSTSADAALDAAVDDLPADADEQARQELAERLAETLAQNYIDYPWLSDPAAHLSKSKLVTGQTFVDAMAELYNPAQLDVLVRANALAVERMRALREEEAPPSA
jgi:DNA-binding transcriptional MerR regulator